MSSPSRLQTPSGIWLPLVTPFHQQQIDDASVVTLISHYNKTPVRGYILGATTGESYALSSEEKQHLINVAQRANDRRLPVFLGLGGSDTRALSCTVQRANEWNINGYLITAPHSVKPTQEGLFQHFWQLATVSRHPIILYNIPGRTCVNMSNDTVFRLAAHENIVGIKDCCGNREQSLDLIARKPNGFSVLIGDDDKFFDYVEAGADGGILASAHLNPSLYSDCYHGIKGGEANRVRNAWSTFAQNLPLLFSAESPNPAPIKHLLACQEIIRSPQLRLPLTAPEPPFAQQVKTAFSSATFG